MLTVLVGTDSLARAKRLEALSLGLKKNGTEIQSYNDVTFDPEAMRMIAGSTSLFGGATAVIISGLGDNADKRDQLEKLIPVFTESPHQFIISENALLAPFMKKAAAKGAAIEEFDQKAKPKKAEAFNVFLLTDAFSDRKRSVAWSLYRAAIDQGVEPRELHGKIFWAVKTLLVAQTAKTVGESGLNPFVYGKAKRASAKFAPGELETTAFELTTLFHEALVSGIELETALEALILRALGKNAAIA